MLIRRIVFAVSALLNIVLFLTLVWSDGRGAVGYKRLKERCGVLENHIRHIGEENLELSKEIRLLQSDAKYLEKVIRNRLNFVRDNEVLYIFPAGNKTEAMGDLPNEAEN